MGRSTHLHGAAAERAATAPAELRARARRVADERRRALVELVELEAAREVVPAPAVEHLVGTFVVEHAAVAEQLDDPTGPPANLRSSSTVLRRSRSSPLPQSSQFAGPTVATACVGACPCGRRRRRIARAAQPASSAPQHTSAATRRRFGDAGALRLRRCGEPRARRGVVLDVRQAVQQLGLLLRADGPDAETAVRRQQRRRRRARDAERRAVGAGVVAPAVAGRPEELVPPEVRAARRDVTGAVRLDRAEQPRLLAHHIAVEVVPVGGRRRHGGRAAAGEQRRVDPGGPADDLVGGADLRTASRRAASCRRSSCCARRCRCRRRSTCRCRPGRERSA